MSTLVFEALDNIDDPDPRKGFKSFLTQEIVIGNHLGLYSPVIKPWLFFTGNPAGVFTMGVYKGATLIMSRSFTTQDMINQLGGSGTSGHLYYNIVFKGEKLEFGTYTLKLTHSGYTFNKTNCLAWCKEWENVYDKNPILPNTEWTQRNFAVRIISLTPREV